MTNTLGLGSKIDQPPPFNAATFKVPALKFPGVEKLNTAAPPPPLWGGPVADARTGGGWDAAAQINQVDNYRFSYQFLLIEFLLQFPSRVNPMFNPDPIITRQAPPPVQAQSNMWNGTMANPSGTFYIHLLIYS